MIDAVALRFPQSDSYMFVIQYEMERKLMNKYAKARTLYVCGESNGKRISNILIGHVVISQNTWNFIQAEITTILQRLRMTWTIDRVIKLLTKCDRRHFQISVNDKTYTRNKGKFPATVISLHHSQQYVNEHEQRI